MLVLNQSGWVCLSSAVLRLSQSLPLSELARICQNEAMRRIGPIDVKSSPLSKFCHLGKIPLLHPLLPQWPALKDSSFSLFFFPHYFYSFIQFSDNISITILLYWNNHGSEREWESERGGRTTGLGPKIHTPSLTPSYKPSQGRNSNVSLKPNPLWYCMGTEGPISRISVNSVDIQITP